MMGLGEDKIKVTGDDLIFKPINLAEKNLGDCVDQIKSEVKNNRLVDRVTLDDLYFTKDKKDEHKEKNEANQFASK